MDLRGRDWEDAAGCMSVRSVFLMTYFLYQHYSSRVSLVYYTHEADASYLHKIATCYSQPQQDAIFGLP
jgi:hypothetical protein